MLAKLRPRIIVPVFVVTALISSAIPMTLAAAAPAAPAASVAAQCATTVPAYDAQAKEMASDIVRLLRGRQSTVGFEVTDSKTGITCTYNANNHFIAASDVKVIILAALLRKDMEQHRGLTNREQRLAWLMITQSDNGAATSLWNDVGAYYRQHFLDLAGMRQTKLAYAWGLTLLTAHDETILLNLLTSVNNILDKPSRLYARYLMAHVVAAQRWGVPAGAPRTLLVHVKNGWLPYGPGGWEVNSIGAFTSAHRVYLMTMLTYNNPSMAYGISTIERVAVQIHKDLNPAVPTGDTIPSSNRQPSWGVPDEPPPTGPVG